jgi:hypothetical protein
MSAMSDDTTPDTTRRVSETAQPIEVRSKVKRGTGTRDQDTHKVVVTGDNPKEVVGLLNETLARLHNTAEDVRAMQPADALEADNADD